MYLLSTEVASVGYTEKKQKKRASKLKWASFHSLPPEKQKPAEMRMDLWK